MLKVLIVEDSPSQRELMISSLICNNYQVIAVENAMHGMELAVKEKPDVIITDITMDGMSGFEFCRLLRIHPSTRYIPVIACTTRNRNLDRLWAKKQGIDLYITKPYSQENIVQAVKIITNCY